MSFRPRARAVLGIAAPAAAAFVALALAGPPAAHAAGTLVHAYHADGDAKDAVLGADASDGVLLGNTTFGAGAVGQGFAFDGDDDYVSVPSNPSFYPSGSFTVDGRIATSAPVPDVGHQQATIAVLYECGGLCPTNQANSVWQLLVYDGRAYGFVRDTDASGPVSDGGGEVITAGPLLNDGVFHRVVMVRDLDAGVLALYADGIEVAELPINAGADGALADTDGQNDPLTIGATILGGTTTPVGEVTGSVDEVRYLTGAEYPDDTPPSIAPVVAGAVAGGGGWLTAATQVSWTIGDESIIRTRSGCDPAPVADGVTTLTCTATSAGGTGTASVTVRRDATAPAVTCGAPPSFAVGAPGTVTATVTDAGSGPAQTNVSATADTRQAGSRAAAVSGRDVAGNATTVACPYVVAAPAAPKAVAITTIATLPPAKACVSRRRFPIRLRGVNANRLVRAQVRLNGRQVRNITGRALKLPIDLRGLPKGRFTVEIVTTDSAGKQVLGRRTYRTCVARRR